MATWIITWDDQGLEALINWTELYHNDILMRLTEDTARKPNLTSLIDRLQFRARYNNHRNPEAYAINFGDNITEDNIRSYFDFNSNAFKDLIRSKTHYVIWDNQIDMCAD